MKKGEMLTTRISHCILYVLIKEPFSVELFRLQDRTITINKINERYTILIRSN